MIEESWVASYLNHTGLFHGLIHDYVENLAHCLALGPVGIVNVSSVDDELAFMVNDQGDLSSLELGVDHQSFSELLLRPQVEA